MEALEKPAANQSSQPVFVAPGEGLHLSLMGDEQWHKISAHQTGGLLSMFETEDAPGVGIPLHYHIKEDETFYVLEGAYEFTIGQQRIVATKGATLFAPRNIPHAWKVSGDQPARMLVMLLPGGGEKMFKELHEACKTAVTPEQIGEICTRYDVIFLPPE